MILAQRRPDRTLGPGHDTFWQWCGQDELRLPRCRTCLHLAWPVVQECDLCKSTDFTWERLSGRAHVVSWCSFEKDYYAGILPLPWDTLLVELEEGPLFISNPHECGVDIMKVGMRLKVAFIDCEDQAGSFRLPVFEIE